MKALIIQSRILMAAALVAAVPVVHASEEPWAEVECSDAGYGGRPAFKCTTSARGVNRSPGGGLSLEVWVNPRTSVKAHIELRPGLRVGSDEKLVDPIQIKVDGRTVREYAPAEVEVTMGEKEVLLGSVPFSEALVQELSSGRQIALHGIGTDGQPVQFLFPTGKALGEVTARARSGYQAYHVDKRSGSTPTDARSAADAWGPLGEAADRSQFWISRSTRLGDHLLELTWTEPDKVLRTRVTSCAPNCSLEPVWHVRLNPDAVVNGKAATVLDVYGQANKPVVRFQRPDEKGVYWASTFDPILQEDLNRSRVRYPGRFGKSRMPCCFQWNGKDYSPATADEAEKLLGDARKEEQGANKREQEAAEEARRQREEAAADARRLARESEELIDEVNRSMEAARRSAPSFAGTLQRELEAGRDRDAKQQQFLSDLQRRIQPGTARNEPGRAEPPTRMATAPRDEPRQVSPRPSAPPQESQAAARAIPDSRPVERTTPPRSNLLPTPEALVVCTKPDEAGAFECDTPVNTNLRGGPKNGLASWNTPETMIVAMAESCPGARRLPSTTHLVWGCGFGATNNSNSMNRSAGVDVKGRNTYYCSEKQTSCRRTEP